MGKLRLKPQAFVSNSYTANNYRILPLNNSLAVRSRKIHVEYPTECYALTKVLGKGKK